MIRAMLSVFLYLTLALTLLFCIAVYLTCACFIHPSHLHPLVRILTWLILFSGGQWLKIEGQAPQPENGPYLYLFNHESLFDPFMLGTGIKHYFSAVAKKEMISWPLWNIVIKRYGVVPIERQNLEKAIDSLSLAEEAIHQGISFMMAPEGSRSKNGELQMFKKGPFHVAKNTGVTIVPVVVLGPYEAKNKNDWRIKPGVLTLRFGEPIKFDDCRFMDIEELRDYVRAIMVGLIEK